MATSLHAAAGIDCDWMLVVLGDQPFVGTAHLHALFDARDAALTEGAPLDAVASRYEDRVAVPALLSCHLAPRLLALRGDTGAREILRMPEEGGRVRTVPLPLTERHADIDTQQDLAWFRAVPSARDLPHPDA